MISAKSIIDKTNQYIGNTSITDLQFTQLSAVDGFLANSNLTVTHVGGLPIAEDYVGVTVYVSSEQQYYFSDGIYWRKEFASDYEVINQTPYAWGRNGFGEIGDNTASSRSSPVAVAGNITTWRQIESGTTHVLGLTDSGVLYAWGDGGAGAIGDNTTSQRSSPVTVVGGITNWKAISAGGGSAGGSGAGFNLACTINGILYAWGFNSSGQLGDGTTSSRLSPITVAGGITSWTQVSAGGTHSLALTSSGLAYSWGSNTWGELGDNTGLGRSSPVIVVGGITTWKQLSAGGTHSLGVTTTGIAYAWGQGSWGQLGTGNTSSRSSPVIVVGGITTWASIIGASRAPSTSASFGLLSSGILYAWGNNDYGRLGDNTTTARSSPVTVVGGITNWSQVSAARGHTAGVTLTGRLYSWGYNGLGQLGDNTISSRRSPVTPVGGITNWTQVSAGSYGSVALSTSTLVTKGFV